MSVLHIYEPDYPDDDEAPALTIAAMIAAKHGVGSNHALVAETSSAIEDARDRGEGRGKVMAELRNSVVFDDMLAALKRAVARADIGLPNYRSRTPECQADYDLCVAAIKKADGKS